MDLSYFQPAYVRGSNRDRETASTFSENGMGWIRHIRCADDHPWCGRRTSLADDSGVSAHVSSTGCVIYKGKTPATVRCNLAE
ncbi:hypothetical protein D3C76_1535640 [compost metagenome]